MRSSIPRPGALSGWPSRVRTDTRFWTLRTTGLEYLPRRSAMYLTVSSGSTRRARATRAAPAWGFPSSNPFARPMAPRWKSKASLERALSFEPSWRYRPGRSPNRTTKMKIEMKHFEKLLPQWKNWPWLRSRWAWRILAAGAILVAVLLLRPGRGYARLTSRAEMETPPSIAVAKLEREDLFREVTIPAEFRPYAEVELHAKVSGYLQQINVDIGDRVKAGQLLATLEVPELQDQLNNAIATKQRAEADYKNAHLVYTRLLAVNKDHPNLVAQQDLDTAESKDSTTAALIAEAKANVERYQTMVAYTRITAPFDGTITHRYADPGALIQAGTASDTQSMPLVRLSDNYRLRLDFPVSVDYVQDIQMGDAVDVRVESLGGKMFTGKIS